jgi:hypothetical protein
VIVDLLLVGHRLPSDDHCGEGNRWWSRVDVPHMANHSTRWVDKSRWHGYFIAPQETIPKGCGAREDAVALTQLRERLARGRIQH